ncbi:MAG: uncharacterized protein PWP03_334 [Candidatus Woesearchaeota archaeon]|nr:uncharacterized protein [Candidatus Woesearchaeota archaeon]MDN5327696.1 uncharacterized protein [Candidatus Woesearchaeota archaeon]
MLTIVGLDPGTTFGLAILDLDSNIVFLGSFRVHDLKTIIDKVFEFGKPLVLATDKVKVPSFIQNLSSRLGVKVITPKYDISLREKNEINRIYDFIANNSHERDALAGAFFAYKTLKATVEKVRRSAQDMFEDTLPLVINKEQNLNAVLSSFSEKTEQTKKPAVKTKSELHKQRLSAKISELKSEIRFLKFEIFELKSKLKEKDLKISSLKKEVNTKVRAALEKKQQHLFKVIQDKEQAIDALSKKIKELEEENKKIKNILSSQVLLVVPKEVSLTTKTKIKDKYLFVKHSLVDEDFVKNLFDKGIFILTDNHKLKNLIYLKKIYYETGRFVVVSLNDVEEALSQKHDVDLYQFIEEYKKKRRERL